MKKYSKIVVFVISLLLFIPFTLAETPICQDGWCVIGGAGGKNPPSGKGCNDVVGFCPYNTGNGTKGVRVSLALCTGTECKSVTKITTSSGTEKKLHPSKDIFNATGTPFYPGEYYYVGKTKIDQEIYRELTVEMIKNESNNKKQGYGYENMDFVDVGKKRFFLFPNSNGSQYFNDLASLQSQPAARDEFINTLLEQLSTGETITQKDMEYATTQYELANGQCTNPNREMCPGYRILIEPIFMYYRYYASEVWMATPSEISRLAKTGSAETGHYIGPEAMQYTVRSLYMKANEVFFKTPTYSSITNDNFYEVRNTMITDKKNGYALNTLNPAPNYSPSLTCEFIQKSIRNYDNVDQAIADAYPNFSSLKDIAYQSGNEIKYADIKWYINECTCYGMYEYFQNTYINSYKNSYKNDIEIYDKYFGSTDWRNILNNLELGQLSKNKISTLLTTSPSFIDYNKIQQAYVDELNKKGVIYQWTPVDEQKYFTTLKCGSTITSTTSCQDVQTWYDKSYTHTGKLDIANLTKEQITGTHRDEIQKILNAYNVAHFYIGKQWTINGGTYDYTTCAKDWPHETVENTCETLQTWYNKNKPSGASNITQLTIPQIRSNVALQNTLRTKFEEYNREHAGSGIIWTIDTDGGNNYSYIKRCMSDIPDSPIYNCTPSISIGNCQSGSTISYNDKHQDREEEEYWNKCIFNDHGLYDNSDNQHKWSSLSNGLSYRETSLGNNYCEVYCTEELEAQFPTNYISRPAGSNFVWGASTITGSRTCKVKGNVDYVQFNKDVKKAKDAIVDAYVQWQLAIKQQAEIDKAAEQPNGQCTYENEIQDTVYTTKTWNSSKKDWDCEGKCDRPASAIGYDSCDPGVQIYASAELDENGTPVVRRWRTTCYKTETSYRDKYTYQGVSFNVNSNFGTKKSDRKSGSYWCGNNKPSVDVTAKKALYDQKVQDLQSLITKINNCTNWDNSTLYNLDPSLKLYYSDGYYQYLTDNEMVTTIDFAETYDNSKGCTTETVYPLNCNGTSCTNDTNNAKTYQSCTSVSKTREIHISAHIADNVFRYVRKSDHQSIHVIPENVSPEGFKINYMDIGYSNLPISFKTPAGTYGYNQNRGELRIEYANLGHRTGSSSTAVDIILNNANNIEPKYGDWACTYTVTNGLIPDKNIEKSHGIRVIYRPIDLQNPFPDMDASGRQTGSNWCYRGDCSNDNRTVQNYILNNRGVEGDKIYQKEPMYVFELTAADILEIRKYNRANGYDKYTGSLDNKNYDFKCNDQGGTCISDYLTKLIKDTSDGKGTCIDDKYRTYTDSANFEACR